MKNMERKKKFIFYLSSELAFGQENIYRPTENTPLCKLRNVEWVQPDPTF